MNIAAIHCWLFSGGALEVFKDLIQQELRNFPHAEIKVFTMLADEPLKTLEIPLSGSDYCKEISVVEVFPKRVSKIFTSCSRKKIPIFSTLFDYRNLIVFYPRIMRVLSWKVRRFKPERVVISSFAIGKNISLDCHASLRSTCDSVSTKLYLHSPMQYVWSHKEEYLAKFSGRKKRLFSFLVPRLQKWDKQFRQFDEVFFNSKYTQALAKKIYGMEGKISYPKLKDTFYYAGVRLQPQNYFVCVGRLVTFVRECDMIIEAFNQLQLPLLMIGAGPDEQYLKSLAGDTIIFLGWLSPEDTQKVVKDAKALVNMTKESFGMGTVEALLMGVPIIGFADGATPELVDKESGILIEKKSVKNLIAAVEEFQTRTWDRKQISEHIREKLVG